MNIQSLSIAVPAGCPNRCKYCVSKLHRNCHENKLQEYCATKLPGNFRESGCDDIFVKDYLDALAFARDNDCNTMILTGTGEAILNRPFVNMVAEFNERLSQPFRCIELQTSGVYLLSKDGHDENLKWLREDIRVKTISLSLSSIWSSEQNAEYTCPQNEEAYVNIEKTCKAIKDYGFTLRLSLNMTDFYNDKSPEEIFRRAKELGANQVTFRVLYNVERPQNAQEREIHDWINQHSCKKEKITEIKEYIKTHRCLGKLPFGAIKFSVNEMSCIIDGDSMNCMNSRLQPKKIKEEVKYLILRPNCKLYTHWDDEGSLLF